MSVNNVRRHSCSLKQVLVRYSMPVCIQERGTRDYDVVVVGHSLGAGTAAILAILLRQEYPRLHCYAYSPPGGLLR